ncbi:hypothetical protein [Arthrobacter yangruifuii]|uniref:hypothetical protein n=1 Tax=Arthrobacter yangruifuii TaxID=2606616 RepID=UPI001644AD89|nr:hypothetical protein [Arthrobacter yangruifuii]
MAYESSPAAVSSDASAPQRRPRPRTPASAWAVLVPAAVLLWVATLPGSFGVLLWLLGAGVLLILTAIYALGFRRRSWANLYTLEQRKFALTLGGVVLVVGAVAGVVATPKPVADAMKADAEGLRPRPDLFAPPTTPSTLGSVPNLPAPDGAEPAEGSADRSNSSALLGAVAGASAFGAAIANKACATPGDTRVQAQVEYRCTTNRSGELVWLERSNAEQLAEERAAAVQQAEADRQAEEARARQAEERTRADDGGQPAQPPNQPGQPPNQPDPSSPTPAVPAPVNPPAGPPAGDPTKPPTQPPTDPPTDPPTEPPTQPPAPTPTPGPTQPPSPDPTFPPVVPPTPPGQPDPRGPVAPDPDLPVLPPEFPVQPGPPSPSRTTPPPSSALPAAVPDATPIIGDPALQAR